MTRRFPKRVTRLATIAVAVLLVVGSARYVETASIDRALPVQDVSPSAEAAAGVGAQLLGAALVSPPGDPALPELGQISIGRGAEPSEVAAAPGPADPCAATLRTTAIPGGMIYAALDAPCDEGRVTLSHAGLDIDMTVPPGGRLAVSLPVLDPAQPLEARLPGGRVLRSAISASGSADFAHVVLQWQGPAGMGLHALEFGDARGGGGHVWAGAPRDVLTAMRGEGGFLTRLGDAAPGSAAEVYTYPVGEIAPDGEVALSVEAIVTAENCGRDLSGKVLRRSIAGRIEAIDLAVAMPDCSAIGDILVLKNILQDMKIAAN